MNHTLYNIAYIGEKKFKLEKFIERDSFMAISQPSSMLHQVPQLIGLMMQLKFLAHMLQNSEIKDRVQNPYWSWPVYCSPNLILNLYKADMVSSFQKIKLNLLKKKCMLLSQRWETKLWQDVAIANKSLNKSYNVHLNNRVGVQNKYLNMKQVVFEAK